MNYRGRSIRRVGLVCVLALAALVLSVESSLAAGIRVVPSAERVLPGEDFYLDIVAENIPVDDGLGTVQFRLNVEAPGAKIAGVADLGQATADSVSVATPLLISPPTGTRSGLGEFFGDARQGSGGVLVLDNETLSGGSALFTYAHTHGANRPSGTGAVARFLVHVGTAVAAERIDITISDVLLLDGGPAYPLDSNVGATVTLRCTAAVPDLAGKSLSEAQSALTAAGLTFGSVYEIDNPSGASPLGVVLAQSAPAGFELDCEAAVDMAINVAPTDVTNLSAADVAGDDTGRLALTWTPSTSADTAGYRVYVGQTLLAEVPGAQAAGCMVEGLEIGVTRTLRVAAYDSFGNQSTGVVVDATALDEVPPAIIITGVESGAFFNAPVTPAVDVAETNPAGQTVTLNGEAYLLGTPIVTDGGYTLAVSATDAAGNTASASVAFTVDTVAPTITIVNLAEGAFYSSDVTPQIAVVDVNLDAAATTLTLNGQPYTGGTPITEDGAYTLNVSARDRAGNTASLAAAFTLDRTAPLITLEGVTDGAWYTTDVTPVVTVADGHLKTSSVNLNGAPFATGTTLSAEGEYHLAVSGQDEAGNSAELSLTFGIDKTVPAISVAGVADGAFYNTDVVPVVAVTDANLAESSMTLNGQPFASGTVLDGEGEYALELSGVDRAGNQSAVVIRFVIDKTAPVISVSGVADGALYNAAVTPTVAIDDSFIADSLLTLNAQPYLSGTVVSDEGTYTLAASAGDRAGNSAILELGFVIDTTAPQSAAAVGAPQFAQGAELYVAGGTEIVLSAADSGVAPTEVAEIRYALDQTAQWELYASPLALAGLADGQHQVYHQSTDRAGNVEEARSLTLILDQTAPASAISLAGPQYSAAGRLYVTSATAFTLAATDELAGIAGSEYRLDEGEWIAYAPFTLSGDGNHVIGYRSADLVGNAEPEKYLSVVLDNSAPATSVATGTPQYLTADGTLYVTSGTSLTLSATDELAGVAATQYRFDGGDWQPYAGALSLGSLADGLHEIGYRSVDHLGNLESERRLDLVLDSTPPVTAIRFDQQSYLDGEKLLISGETKVVLNAADELSGLATTQYRFDAEAIWRGYYGAFSLTGLDFGAHTLHYRSIDNVDNIEAEKSVAVTLLGVEVTTEILNLPRVLVWSEDPAKLSGKNHPAWTLDEVRGLLGEALGVPDVYAVMVEDREAFRRELRSGIYNMTMIVNQDVPFDTNFLRELREAVNRGTGLLVSSWGNSVPPLLQDLFGVDFKGSLAMDAAERTLYLYQSPVSAEQTLAASGRVLKTLIDGGTLGGVVLGESTCNGLRGLTLHYPAAVHPGDRVTATLATAQGKKSVTVDEEELAVADLPTAEVNRFAGNVAGDLAIVGATADGVTLSLASPYGYLEASYNLTLTIEGADGSRVTTGAVAITPVCSANLRAGVNLGPFRVRRVDEDRVKSGDGLPAVVLGRYGEGRTAFFSYNLIESALNGQRAEHLSLLRRAATYLLPEEARPEAGGVALLESRLKLEGGDLDLQATDTLGEGLTHLTLFDLTQSPLTYSFHLAEGEEAAWRYFVRVEDRSGDFAKTTDVSLMVDGDYVPFASKVATLQTVADSRALLRQALVWVEAQTPVHPEATDALGTLREALLQIDSLPRGSATEAESIIHLTVQTLHQALQLGFDVAELRSVLDDYLRIVEGMGYFAQ